MEELVHNSKSNGRGLWQVLFADGRRAPTPRWVLESSAEGENICLILLDPHRQIPVALISDLVERWSAVVVIGPAGAGSWREEAMSAGAFGCLSETTPQEDRIGLLHSARRYQSAQSETASLRSQHDRLCGELVQSFGDAMEKLSVARHDARSICASLEELRLRVIRTLM